MVYAIWIKCQAATVASIAGLYRLTKETAFLYECYGLLGLFVLFFIVGATGLQMLVLGGIGLLIFALEALNTAIEVIVDHISPEWSKMAKQAKDLGSFAVGCALLLLLVYSIYVCCR